MFITYNDEKRVITCYKKERKVYSLSDLCDYLKITDIEKVKKLYKSISRDEYYKCRVEYKGVKTPFVDANGMQKIFAKLEEMYPKKVKKIRKYKLFFESVNNEPKKIVVKEEPEKLDLQKALEPLLFKIQKLELEVTLLKLENLKKELTSKKDVDKDIKNDIITNINTNDTHLNEYLAEKNEEANDLLKSVVTNEQEEEKEVIQPVSDAQPVNSEVPKTGGISIQSALPSSVPKKLTINEISERLQNTFGRIDIL